ncbi:hypothetical protein M0657_010231 [Pyricularia oryzae]|uniref:Uncharacterized protein n=2 Tax=Pyricularia oryzae TaxID=318829 RepID=A0AA97P8E6_PYRO3|nr:hypothetical protein OOU_Y34scaffold00132g10 [Pyricularia oryzae Y34]KAI7912054.1 hypothetical protein M9X92_010223 [Pyricularia oryzae]KAI7912951.1 hypothetical protein M0657_010231 [Pyricularia oryzae]
MQLNNLFFAITGAVALLPTAYAGKESYKVKKICHYSIQKLHGKTWYQVGTGQADAGKDTHIEGTKVFFSNQCLPQWNNRRLYIKLDSEEVVPV